MKYFGWVLLLELVCIASPLRADTTGTMCGLLPPRNHKDHFPFFRVWRVRKEWDRCSPPSVQQKVTECSRHKEQHHRQGQQHSELPVGISSGFRKYFWADVTKHRASGARQECRTRATFLNFIQPQFEDTELALDLFSIYETLTLLFKSRESYQL